MMPAAGFAGAAAASVLALGPAWKWQLGLRRAGAGLAAITAVSGGVVTVVSKPLGLPAAGRALAGAGLSGTLAVGVLAYRFYRDPERTPPAGEHLVVSPADGEIVYVKRVADGRMPVAAKHGREVALQELTHTEMHTGEALVVGIGMSFLDVHVNRAPIGGRVLRHQHHPGRFGSLRVPEMVLANERTTTLIGGTGMEVAVVQIASRLVRQIASYIGEGDEVALGQRIGIIRLGSQVDVVLPRRRDLAVLVGVGDRVQAGTSVIATLAGSSVPGR